MEATSFFPEAYISRQALESVAFCPPWRTAARDTACEFRGFRRNPTKPRGAMKRHNRTLQPESALFGSCLTAHRAPQGKMGKVQGEFLDYPQTVKRLARRPRAELARRCLSSLVSPHCGISGHVYCSASSSWHGSSGSSSGPSRPFHLPWRANSRQTPSAMA